MSTGADLDTAALVERFTLKALVESCLVVEEGVASMKDVDLGMMAGAGIIPPPFARADQLGLDEVLTRLEHASNEWGEGFEPPTILRRLVAQGRLGVKSGQGFFPYARPDGVESAKDRMDGFGVGGVLIERQQLQLDGGQMFSGFQNEIVQQFRIARQRVAGRCGHGPGAALGLWF